MYNGYFAPNDIDPNGELVIFVHGVGSTQHKDKAPYVYAGMQDAWKKKGAATQSMIHFLYGPANVIDPFFEDEQRNVSAASALKSLVDNLQKRRSSIKGCDEPIYIYAYSNGAIVTKLALAFGMKVDGVVFSGAALDADTKFGSLMGQTPYIYNFHSDEDGTNVMSDGAGRYGFRKPDPGVTNIPVPKVDHYVDDGYKTAGSSERIEGYTEWDSNYMGRRYGEILTAPNSSLSTDLEKTPLEGVRQAVTGSAIPTQFSSPITPGYYHAESGVK
jgi:predicted esterase